MSENRRGFFKSMAALAAIPFLGVTSKPRINPVDIWPFQRPRGNYIFNLTPAGTNADSLTITGSNGRVYFTNNTSKEIRITLRGWKTAD